ncbi:MAG: rhodanese-like domain-containing protein [bacterium]
MTSPGGAFQRALREGALLLAISAALAFGVNAARAKPLPLRTDPRLLALQIDMPVISATDAALAFDAGDRIFLDARETDVFREGHIGGAFSVAAQEFDDRYGAISAFLSPETPIIVYGDEARASDVETVARRLKDAGHTNISLLLDGFGGWEKALAPVEAGDDPTMMPFEEGS